MTFALTLLFGCVIGGVIVYLVMRRDDKPSEIVLESQLLVKQEEAEAAVALEEKLGPAREDRAELDEIKKIPDKRERFEKMAEFANQKNPKRKPE